MKAKLLLYGSALLSACIVWYQGALQLQAENETTENTDKVGAPHPVRFPTHNYVPEPASEKSRLGELLYKEANCLQCHSIKNAGGTLGPMLDGIGYRRSPDFIFAHLADTRDARESYFRMTGQNRTAYIHPRVSSEDAQALVAFLMTVPEPEGGFVLMPHVMSLPSAKPNTNSKYKPEKDSQSSKEGRKLFNNKGCIACHTINNVGGWMGPKLDGVGGRIDRAKIIENIQNPAAVSKKDAGNIDVLPQMPKLKLTEDEIEKITDYLLTLPNSAGNE